MEPTISRALAASLKYPSGRNTFTVTHQPGRLELLSILDEFSQSVHANAANLWPISPIHPEIDFTHIRPDALFVESAWSGNQGAWRYLISSTTGPKTPFRELLSQCASFDIPSFFWNKEDPVHFKDFIDAAKLFDYAFTTDGDLIDRYRDQLGHDRVELMRFSAAPNLHNPRFVDGYRAGDVAFAGQYFQHKYPERRAQMDTLFAASLDHRFSIFSRMLGGDPNYQFPNRYSSLIRGSLPYTEMVNEYKRHKIFLNVNSVTTSSTMCARRVFELSAAKTVVMSIESEAIASVYQNGEVLLVPTVDDAREALVRVIEDNQLRRQIAQSAWRTTARHHTVHHRMTQLKKSLGVDDTAADSIHIVLHVLHSKITEQLLHELNQQSIFSQPRYSLTLNLVGTGALPDIDCNFNLAKDQRPDRWPDAYQGTVSGEFHYGPYYLEDHILQLTYFGSESIVTKADPRIAFKVSGTEEQPGTSVHRGAWLSRPYATVSALIRKDLTSTRRSLLSRQTTYISDPLSFAIVKPHGNSRGN